MLYALTLALFVVLTFCLWADFVRTCERPAFPFVTFVSAYYFCFYGALPLWTAAFEKHPVYPLEISGNTAVYAVAFVVLQVAGFLVVSEFLRRRKLPVTGAPDTQDMQDTPDAATRPLLALALVFIGGYLLFEMFDALQRLPSLNQLRQPMWNFGFALLIWQVLTAKRSVWLIVLAVVLFGIHVGLNVLNGLITSVVMTVLITLLCALTLRRFKLAAGAVLVALVLMSSYGYVKFAANTLYRGGQTNVFLFKPNLSTGSMMASVNALARRSAHSLVLQKVIEKTPSEVPFADHTPFLDAARNHVPRLLWPGKPGERVGNWFGTRYGFIAEDDTKTSWNLPWVSEFYLTFGYVKAALASLVLGGMFAGVIGLLSRRRPPAVGFALFAASVFPLFYQESNFSVMTGGFLWVLAFCGFGAYLFLYLYRRAFGNV